MGEIAAFETSGLSKYFGGVKALDNVTITAKQGTIFGLLGPNGAGKTTLVNMLATLSKPTRGTLKVLGVDVIAHPDKVRNLIGLAGQFAAIDEYLTGEENLYMVARLYKLNKKEAKIRTGQLLKDLNLIDAKNRQVRTFSGGMRRRLDLGASLVGQPKILFLDEPTTGLDPRTRQDLWVIIRKLIKAGTSILLTTQYLEEADELADHIAVIDRGKLIAEGTSAILKSDFGGDVIRFEIEDINLKDKAIKAVQVLSEQKAFFIEEELCINLPVGRKGPKKMIEVVRALDKARILPVSLSLHQPTLDDVFLKLTGNKALDKEIKDNKKKRRQT